MRVITAGTILVRAIWLLLLLAVPSISVVAMDDEAAAVMDGTRTVASDSAATQSTGIDTVAVLPVAGSPDEVSLEEFGNFLKSLEALTTAPDLLIMYQDWNAYPIFAEMIQDASRSFTFPVQVVSRPKDQVHLYPTDYHNGHLKLFFWWIINTTFVTTSAKQVCYFEDDTAIHPDFLAWVKHVRSTIPRNDYWGLWGKGGPPYVPICIDIYEWSLLLKHYEHFCYKPVGHWDISLFNLHQHGILPSKRAETTTPAAQDLPYVEHLSTYEAKMEEVLTSDKLDMEEYDLVTPRYEGNTEPSGFADLNFEIFYESIEQQALTQTQLFKIIENCVEVALDAKSKLEVDSKLVPNHVYAEFVGLDIEDHDIAYVDGLDVEMSKQLCNENLDCHGFVHYTDTNETRFKSWTSTGLLIVDDPDLVLFSKKCERLTSQNLCIPSYNYVG